MTEPLLNFEELLTPLAGEEGEAGPKVPFTVKDKLAELRKEREDPLDPEGSKKADWPETVRLAKETLTSTSKDLQVAAQLTEALVHLHGFLGLRDGLRLLRELVERFWDKVNPLIEDGDVEIRAGPFNWLDKPVRGVNFPTTLRQVPLIHGREGHYSLLDWNRVQKGEGEVSREEIDKTIQEISPERYDAEKQVLDESHEELEKLSGHLIEKMGPEAPTLDGLREIVEDGQRWFQYILSRRPDLRAKTDIKGKEENGEPPPEQLGGAAASLRTREEAYRALRKAADILRDLEPHSPIPYLIERAVELGAMPFPQLMKALIRNDSVLDEMNRELGIKEGSEEE
jgi:type VI secretion system protein ImpA